MESENKWSIAYGGNKKSACIKWAKINVHILTEESRPKLEPSKKNLKEAIGKNIQKMKK